MGVVGGLAVLTAGACARQGAPPGGPEDRRPPVVVRTVPENLGTVTDLDAEVRFDFDERISERVAGGAIATAVSISPRAGDLRVSHHSRAITLRVDGGFQPGLVYRVTLEPVVSDLFGNQLADPFELVFSTGGEAVPTTLAGEIWNRVSGQPAAEVTVLAVDEAGLVHEATTDQNGIFAFRYLPPSRFAVTAFEDLNRNTEVDSMEVQGGTVAEIAVGDTVLVDLSILQPDTSAARMSGAEAFDSVSVVVEFDDFLDPAVPAASIEVAIRGAGGADVPVERVFHEGAYAAYVDTVADSLARLDSIDRATPPRPAGIGPADSVAALDSVPVVDSAAVADSVPVVDSVALPDTVDLPEPAPVDTVDVLEAAAASRRPPTRLNAQQGTRPGLSSDGRRVLPGRRVVVRVASPLEGGATYEVEAGNVVNINGLGGGGGVDTLTVPVDTVVADTLGVDTLSSDTLLVDTLVAAARRGGWRP